MKFNKEKYPILEYLGDFKSLVKFNESGYVKSLASLHKSGNDSLLDALVGTAKAVCIADSIDYVAATFIDKVLSQGVQEKLIEHYNEIEECQGIFLYPRQRFSKIHAAAYIVVPSEDGDPPLLDVQLFSSKGRVANVFVKINKEISFRSVLSQNVGFTEQSGADTWIEGHIHTILMILLFKQFAEVETKEIGGKDNPKKAKVGAEKYLNETDTTVNILDCNWFTTIVRSKGFGVKGHFRMQPCGEGMRQRKLIYIEDFVKQGYSRKAKILTT